MCENHGFSFLSIYPQYGMQAFLAAGHTTILCLNPACRAMEKAASLKQS